MASRLLDITVHGCALRGSRQETLYVDHVRALHIQADVEKKSSGCIDSHLNMKRRRKLQPVAINPLVVDLSHHNDVADFGKVSRLLGPAERDSAVNLRCNNPELPMSALGHKRTLNRLHPMSALPPKADIKPVTSPQLWEAGI